MFVFHLLIFVLLPPITTLKPLQRLTQAVIKQVTEITFSGIFPGLIERSMNNRADFNVRPYGLDNFV